MRKLLELLSRFRHARSPATREQESLAAPGGSRPRNIAITIITRIEVLRARSDYLLKAATAAQLQTAQHWLNESERLLAEWRIVSFDDAAVREFDRLRSQKVLRKIGRADLLIACIALANNATVVTRNIRDFKLVPGLSVENWVD